MPKKKKVQTKASFVRQLPYQMPAKDVVDKAKAAGLSMSEKYVYVIRSKMKKTRPGASSSAPSNASSGLESVLRAVASAIGLPNAIALLEADRALVRKHLRA